MPNSNRETGVRSPFCCKSVRRVAVEKRSSLKKAGFWSLQAEHSFPGNNKPRRLIFFSLDQTTSARENGHPRPPPFCRVRWHRIEKMAILLPLPQENPFLVPIPVAMVTDITVIVCDHPYPCSIPRILETNSTIYKILQKLRLDASLFARRWEAGGGRDQEKNRFGGRTLP
ncbi:unnamed protein product [Larinioides sclopetarius]|uniref:Uncharacterized protein n=1 Tax=Larinioides sclopetarius TaxID=280406 RepID=A0AAV2BUK6_9ARAC